MLLHNKKTTKLAHLCVLSCIQAPIALITNHVGTENQGHIEHTSARPTRKNGYHKTSLDLAHNTRSIVAICQVCITCDVLVRYGITHHRPCHTAIV